MDILFVLMLLFAAWLGGHALDLCFSKIDKAFHADTEQDEIYGTAKTASKYSEATKHAARLYLVPSATVRN